jgi:hypothetical protein
MNNPMETKPIVDVQNTLHTISRNINQLKMDIICIKSDLSIIKDYINEKKKIKLLEEKEISKGWWYS